MGLRDEFIVGRLYRLAAWTWTNHPHLPGKVVAYLGHYPEMGFMGVNPHLVGLVLPDGSVGDRYLVRASIICRL